MKSCTNNGKPSFSTAEARLLRWLALRINSGEFTERGMARFVGVSQPQFHNVLKGKRKLQTKLADRIMQKFDLGILDLFSEAELREQLIARAHKPTPVVGEHLTSSGKIFSTQMDLLPRKHPGRSAHHSAAQDLAS